MTIVCDDYNGRWRVISPSMEWKSISWTKRGYQNAALEATHQSWVYYQDATGHTAPFSLTELRERYSDAAPVAIGTGSG